MTRICDSIRKAILNIFSTSINVCIIEGFFWQLKNMFDGRDHGNHVLLSLSIQLM